MSGVICEYCDGQFDPVRFRWRCPSCGFKADCCTGEPQQICSVVTDSQVLPLVDAAHVSTTSHVAESSAIQPASYPKYAKRSPAVIDLTVIDRSAS
jgi:hypothetical protein